MRASDHSADSPSGVVTVVLMSALLLAAGFVAYFILPKVEAHDLSIGLRPPFALECLLVATHWAIKYFWILVVAGLLAFVLRKSTPGRADRPTISG